MGVIVSWMIRKRDAAGDDLMEAFRNGDATAERKLSRRVLRWDGLLRRFARTGRRP